MYFSLPCLLCRLYELLHSKVLLCSYAVPVSYSVPAAAPTGDCFALCIYFTCWQLLFITVVHDCHHSVLQMIGSHSRLIVFPVSGMGFLFSDCQKQYDSF